MHAIIQEKDQKISEVTLGYAMDVTVKGERLDMQEVRELRDEVSRLRRRNQELKNVLQQFLGVEQESEEDEKGEDAAIDPADLMDTLQPGGSEFFPSSSGFYDHSDDISAQHLSTVMASSMPSNRNEQLNPSAWLSSKAWSDSTGRVEVQSLPPVSIQVLPAIESAIHEGPSLVTFFDLSPAMQSILDHTLTAMRSGNKFVEFSKEGSKRCGHSCLIDNHTVWTIDSPGRFTCKRCFNKKRPCLRPLGNHAWALAPLPFG